MQTAPNAAALPRTPATGAALTPRLDSALDVAETALRRLAAERAQVDDDLSLLLLGSVVETHGALTRLYVALGDRVERYAATDQCAAILPRVAVPEAATLTRWADAWAAYRDALEAAPRFTTRADVAPTRDPMRVWWEGALHKPGPACHDPAQLEGVKRALGAR